MAVAPAPPDAGGHLKELEHRSTKFLSIDWTTAKYGTPAEAAALWQQIAPTGDDWSLKLDEVPDGPIAEALATELLAEGNLTCPALPTCGSAPPQMPELPLTATLTDPCLRRQLALWSFEQLELDAGQLAAIAPALRPIAAMPAPESELVAASFRLAEPDKALEAELMELAWNAGQHALVNGSMDLLDETHVIDAATRVHIDGALDALTAKTHRKIFLAAVGDEKLQPATREQAMIELAGDEDKLSPDVQTAIIGATRSPNCDAAAAAIRMLEKHGNASYVPKKPHGTKPEAILRSLCVLAAYERDAPPNAASALPNYLPKKGLELMRVDYDALGETDPDGDGDVHTSHTNDLVDRASASFPENAAFAQALQHCTQLTCSTGDLDFKLTIKEGLLTRVEIVERPPCQKP